ncbi:MAG: hypothetical protein IJS47_00620 [Clostridia bacterium]|nr:hypothetical protein [Clostridia bacterium]
MKKTILLCFMLIILLTSCVHVKKIDYISNSTSFVKTNQDGSEKIFNEIYYSSININSVEDLDKYITNLDNLSILSYESIKNADYITEEDLNREITYQKNILKVLKNLKISHSLFKNDAAYENAKTYVKTNISDLVKTRINYFEIISKDIDRSSISTLTMLSQIESATLPILTANAEKTRALFLEKL